MICPIDPNKAESLLRPPNTKEDGTPEKMSDPTKRLIEMCSVLTGIMLILFIVSIFAARSILLLSGVCLLLVLAFDAFSFFKIKNIR